MKKILVVDDDPDIREVLTWILEEEGYKVLSLSSGNKVLSTVERESPNLVLLDVMLGDSDGRDICNKLKNAQATRKTPIILISASHSDLMSGEKDCHPEGFISKPFDIKELVTKIHHLAA